jgi:CBS domain containing-hemolysin-like protein
MSQLLVIAGQCGALLLLLLLSASFSGCETAMFSLSRTQVRRLSRGTGRAEALIAALLRDPSRLLTTLLVGNMVINVLFSSLVASLFLRTLGPEHPAVLWGPVAAATGLLLLFGEVTPKVISSRNPLPVARLLALPIHGLSRLLTPARWCLRHLLRLLMAALGQGDVPAWGMLTREEIAAALTAGAATGATSAHGRELAANLLELPSMCARDIMVPRTDVRGVADTLTLAEACAAACACRHSRLPVYHEDLDDIWGFLAITDMPRWRGTPAAGRRLLEFRPRKGQPLAGAQNPVRPVHIYPETAPVERLITDMRRRQVQLALLVDEYGGTAGILTQQDILGEIVGRLASEHPGETPLYATTGQGILVEGQASIRELNRALDLDLDGEAADTIGGLVMQRLGRLPRAGDALRDGSLRFHVIKMAGRRIGALRIERLDDPHGEETAP